MRIERSWNKGGLHVVVVVVGPPWTRGGRKASRVLVPVERE